MIFEQNTEFAENTEKAEVTANIAQGLSGLSGMFSDGDYQTVADGFMLQDVNFESMSWPEIQQAVERLRVETEIRKSRAMETENERERKAAEQAFWQRMALLDEFEQWLYDRKFGRDDYDYKLDYEEDEWEWQT